MEQIKRKEEALKTYDIPKRWAAKFPELTQPKCLREGKYGWFSCGSCRTAQAVAHGMGYKGYTQEEAIELELSNCRTKRESLRPEITVVRQLRREGQRILQSGTNVYVQPDQRKGTKRYKGWVVECYSDNTVKISVDGMGDSIVVEADEFVKARRGTTKGRN